MDSFTSIGQFITNLFAMSGRYLAPCWICGTGFSLVKNRLGVPTEKFQKPGLYWKCPIIDVFDIVDMRLQIHYLSSHSIGFEHDTKKYLFPSNKTLDAQVSFRIKDPLIIYKIKDDVLNNGNLYITIGGYIDSRIHEDLTEFIKDKLSDISSIVAIQDFFNEKYKTSIDQHHFETIELKKRYKFFLSLLLFPFLLYPLTLLVSQNISLQNTLEYIMMGIFSFLYLIFVGMLIFFIWARTSKMKSLLDTSDLKLDDYILIEKVVMTSVDNNLGLRSAT